MLAVYEVGDDGIYRAYSTDDGEAWTSYQKVVNLPKAYSYKYTDDLCTGGTAAASSTLGGDSTSYGPANAFDNILTTKMWASYGTVEAPLINGEWLRYTFTAPQWISKYTVAARNNAKFIDQSPRSWELQYNNGGSWTTVHKVVGDAAWTPMERRTYYVDPLSAGVSSSGYTQWRLLIQENHGNFLVAIGEVEMMAITTDVLHSLPIRLAVLPGALYYIAFEPKTYTYHLYRAPIGENGVVFAEEQELLEVYPQEPWGLQALQEGDTEIVVLGLYSPGSASWSVDGTMLIRSQETAIEIAVHQYKDDLWSAPIVAHYIDLKNDKNDAAHLSFGKINDRFIIAYWGKTGESGFEHQGVRYLLSKDAVFWSRASYLPYPPVDEGTPLFLMHGDNMRVKCGSVLLTSPCTWEFGKSAASIQADLTGYVQSYQFTQQEVGALMLTLLDETGALSNHAILSPGHRVLLEFFAGYHDAVYGPLLVRLGLFEVDELAVNREFPKLTIEVSASDLLGWLSNREAAEFPTYFSGTLVTGDHYTQVVDNIYSGLAHTATLAGAFKTENNTLVVDSDSPAVALTTLPGDLADLDLRVRKSGGSGTYWGLAFHVIDHNNFIFFRYTNDGFVEYGERRRGRDVVAARQSISGVSALRVVMHRSLFSLYTSSDGLNWTLWRQVVQDCSLRPLDGASAPEQPFDRGRCGVMALGKGLAFSDLRVSDFRIPLTLENTFKLYAAYAKFFETEFDDRCKASDSSWQTESGVTVTGYTVGIWGENSSTWNGGVAWG